MGLDMYLGCNDKDVVRALNAKGMVGSNEFIDLYEPNAEHAGIGFLSKYGDVAYWRKANQIHHWFVENVQNGRDDCESYRVSLDQLNQLMETCQEVLDKSKLVQDGTVEVIGSPNEIYEGFERGCWSIEDKTTAEELLPHCSGFFFGDSETYGEDYLHDVEFTRNRLRDILALFSKDSNGNYPLDPHYIDDNWVVSFTYAASW